MTFSMLAAICIFADFRYDAQRRADEEEFRRFMDDSPSKKIDLPVGSGSSV